MIGKSIAGPKTGRVSTNDPRTRVFIAADVKILLAPTFSRSLHNVSAMTIVSRSKGQRCCCVYEEALMLTCKSITIFVTYLAFGAGAA
jgi:hypothetical protein